MCSSAPFQIYMDDCPVGSSLRVSLSPPSGHANGYFAVATKKKDSNTHSKVYQDDFQSGKAEFRFWEPGSYRIVLTLVHSTEHPQQDIDVHCHASSFGPTNTPLETKSDCVKLLRTRKSSTNYIFIDIA